MTESKPSVPLSAILALGVLLAVCAWGVSRWFAETTPRDSPKDRSAATEHKAGTPLTLARSRAKQAERDKLLDPSQDGWETEAFSDQATKLLKKIGKLLAHPEQVDGDSLADYASPDFRCGPLRPLHLNTVFEDRTITVRRGAPSDDLADQAGEVAVHEGAAGLATALGDLIANLNATSEPYVAVKVFLVELSEEDATTSVYFQSSAKTADGHSQQNATWNCRWTLPEDQSAPQLLSIVASDYEEASLRQGKSGPLFADCTEAAFAGQPSYQDQLRYDNHHWAGIVDRSLGIRLRGLHGLALGDVNGDGLDDVYICEPGGLPNRLYIQQVDGTLRDVSSASNVDFLDPTGSALFADLDNDGDQDLVVASVTTIAILENDGQGKFTARRLLEGGEAFQPTAADFDNDGDLDLYICMYEPFGHEETVVAGLPIAIPYHDANNGKPNVFYRNDGDWVFTDATEAVGLDDNNHKFSLAATWEDYDLDGDQDLYVANDFGRNNLYRFDSETGRFADVAAEAGVEDMSTGMSASFGDYNRDGWPDLYVANMWSSAGNRITYQRQFRTDTIDDVKTRYQYLARGNSLFSNAGDGSFQDVSIAAGVTMGRWAWGSVFADINNDGWEDLLIANGWFTGTQTSDL